MGGGGSKKRRDHGSSAGLSTIGAATGAKKEDFVDMAAPGSSHQTISVSKELLDFDLGDEGCPVGETVRDSLTLTNNTRKRVKFRFDPIPTKACEIAFDPKEGTLDTKKHRTKKVNVRMQMKTTESLNFRVNLRISGGETLFLIVRTHAKNGVFGVEPTALDQVEDAGFMVPAVLVQLKRYLVDHDALLQEGIFRLAGDAGEMVRIKQSMNASGSFEEDVDCDVNTVANLLKVWYRDLPMPILNALPTETIFNSGDPDVCMEAYASLPEPQKSLLGWLLNLLADVASFKSTNKMSEQNLAIVVAPNLYDPPNSDPLEGLAMSQKAVQFLHALLVREMERRASES